MRPCWRAQATSCAGPVPASRCSRRRIRVRTVFVVIDMAAAIRAVDSPSARYRSSSRSRVVAPRRATARACGRGDGRHGVHGWLLHRGERPVRQGEGSPVGQVSVDVARGAATASSTRPGQTPGLGMPSPSAGSWRSDYYRRGHRRRGCGRTCSMKNDMQPRLVRDRGPSPVRGAPPGGAFRATSMSLNADLTVDPGRRRGSTVSSAAFTDCSYRRRPRAAFHHRPIRCDPIPASSPRPTRARGAPRSSRSSPRRCSATSAGTSPARTCWR